MPILAQHDPKAVAASAQQVNLERDRLETLPLEANSLLFDVDEKSDRRMLEAIELAPELGVTSYTWTLADNTQIELTVQELSDIYQELRIKRAARAQQLHQEALTFKVNGCTVRDLVNWAGSYS